MKNVSETASADMGRRRRRLDKLARTLDSSIRLPGGYRIGLDGFIGMIPGVGDLVGTLFSAYIILEAARLGTSRATLLRMMLNVLIEAVIGVVPLIGDVFDFVWKANNRNIRLLEAEHPTGYSADTAGAKRLGWTALALLAGFVALVAAMMMLTVWALLALIAV